MTTIPTQTLVIGTSRPPVSLSPCPTARAHAWGSPHERPPACLDPHDQPRTHQPGHQRRLDDRGGRSATRNSLGWRSDGARQGPRGLHRMPSPIGVWGAWAHPPTLPKPSPPVTSSAHCNGLRLVAGVEDASRWGLTSTTTRSRADRRPLPLLATGTGRPAFPPSVPPSPALLQPPQLLPGVGRRPSLRRPWRGSAGAPARWAQCAHAAAFAGERSAPPLFGTLTDGLAKKNGASGQRQAQGLPEAPTGRTRGARSSRVSHRRYRRGHPSGEPPRSPMDASSVVPHRR